MSASNDDRNATNRPIPTIGRSELTAFARVCAMDRGYEPKPRDQIRRLDAPRTPVSAGGSRSRPDGLIPHPRRTNALPRGSVETVCAPLHRGALNSGAPPWPMCFSP
jgi:hypothetical protein